MLWIEAVRQLSVNLSEPFELEFTWRGLHNKLTKLAWLNLMSTEISSDNLAELTEIAQRLANNEPPQYIIGWADFCDLPFKVDSRVLIPRPETEELVQLILAENANVSLKVLDIGTGSGAISVSLAKQRSSWQVTASDISQEALDLAQENAQANEVKIDFIKSDVLDNISEKFDIIVSNPPYIAPEDLAEVDVSVQKFEPASALFAGNAGLAVYEKIAQQTPVALQKSGKIYLEIGYKEGKAVRTLFEEAFPEKTVKIHQDIFGKERMVSVE